MFVPRTNKIGLYSCGPTVYSEQHIGNMRTYVFVDILKRTLNYFGYDVYHVMNYTDVGHLTSDADTGDDKVELAAKKEGKTPEKITSYYIKLFERDLNKLNIKPADVKPKATEHIKEQIDMIKLLEKKGYTYKIQDGIYFDTSKFIRYPLFANLNIEGLKAGKRVDIGDKHNVTDFALWKFSKTPGIRFQEWDSPWGVGFPGWHIECSAMAFKYLGKQFDIHTGGEDHIAVHHTNEIAQTEASFGVSPSVNYWLHSRFLNFAGEKISKSKGTTLTISELEKEGFTALDFRYFVLTASYTKQLTFSLDNLRNSKQAYDKLKQTIIKNKNSDILITKDIKLVQKYIRNFNNAIEDNLNTPKAMSIMMKVLKDKRLSKYDKLQLVYNFDNIFALDLRSVTKEKIKITNEIKELLNKRQKAKEMKDYKLADNIREKILSKGFKIIDTKDGVKITK